MRRTSNKKGSMLMMVMIMLIVAAIIAMKLMPDEQTQVIREQEAFYNSDLSQLREAIDLVRLASKDPNSKVYFNPEDPESTPNGWQDFCATDTSISIAAKIASLSAWGYLRKENIKDNSIPDFLWGTSSSKIYWTVSTNYASNTSFEIIGDNLEPYNWSSDNLDSEDIKIETNVHLHSMAIDEYPYQNKLGDNSRGENAIRMIRIDKSPANP